MAALSPDHIGQRWRDHEQAFHTQTAHRIHYHQLAQQPVQTKGDGQANRNPRRAPALPGQPGHTQRRQRYRQPLQLAQPLAQHHHPEQHAQQRVDEIAQAGFHHVAGIHRPDVQAPVQRDQQAGQAQQPEPPRRGPYLGQPAPATHDAQPTDQQHRTPDDAMGNDQERRHLLEQMPVQREQAPDDEGQGGGPQAVTGFAVAVHARRSLARVMTTTPARITAIAPRSEKLKRSCAIHTPKATAITGLT